MNSDQKKIYEHWEQKAREKRDFTTTGPDFNLRELEIFKLSKFLKSSDFVIDFGCGTGKATFDFSKQARMIVGVDFSKQMIGIAKKKYVAQNLSYKVGNVMEEKDFPEKADVVMSTRCIINLPTGDDQKKAIANMIKNTKKNGTLLLLESCVETFDECDRLRNQCGLDKLDRPWHNHFLSIKDTIDTLKLEFKDVYTSSMGVYYLISRIVHPAFVFPENPEYDNKLNQIALTLAKLLDDKNILGDVSPVILIVAEGKRT